VRDGKLTFVYNFLSIDRTTITASEPLAKGKLEVVVRFAYDGKPGELGKGGTVTLSVNGRNVGSGKIARTAPNTLSIGEGLDVGEDVGSPVDFTYKPPFRFTGTIGKVTIELKPAEGGTGGRALQ
jgi:arylsulfatase